MRVLTTTICYPTRNHPDQGVFVQRRAAALARGVPHSTERGAPRMDVHVVAPRIWCPLLRRHEPIADNAGPLPATCPRMLSPPVLGWATDGIAFASAVMQAIKTSLRAGRPVDLLDAHFVYPDGVGAWLAGRRMGIPVAVTVRGKIVSLSRRTIRRLQIRAMLRGVDARIAVSESLAGWVRRIAGSDLVVHVIPNGINPIVNHLVDPGRARSILGWRPDARYLLAVGHLQKLKGFDRILGILPEVRRVAGDVRLVLAGSRRGERRYRRRVEHMMDACNARESTSPSEPVVQFVGPVPGEDLNLMYNAADLFINASRSEGWNNAICEAMAAGTPVVATDVGGNGEQICSSELGMVVPAGNDEALAMAVLTALRREWNRPLIGAHGCARTWRHVAAEVAEVFERVVAAHAAGRLNRPHDLAYRGNLARGGVPAIEVST